LHFLDTDYAIIVGGWWRRINLEGFGTKRSWPTWRYYPIICLEEMRKTTINVSKNSETTSREPGIYGIRS